MKKSFFILCLLLFPYSACETDLKDGHYTCDPNEPGACPDAWVCQLRGTDGIYRCYESGEAYCQNGMLDPGEICDGAELGEFTCEHGFAICLTNCTAICTECGNGHIELNEFGVGEACDDGNTEDGDGCSSNCIIERSYCVVPDSDECLNWCGDGTINGPELCEPENLGGYDCTDFGFHDGTLACSADCRAFEPSQCEGFCGDGDIHDVEVCDGIQQNNLSCWDFYFSGGDLHCDTGCLREFSGCFNSWNRHSVNTTGNIISIHGTDDTNLFAVSFNGWVGRFDGSTWDNEQLAGDPMLRGVWTIAPDDAWAVGNFGTLLHFDGSTWTATTGFESLHLTGIWGSSSTNLYACGFIPGYLLDPNNPESPFIWGVGIILHYDGVDWTEVLRHGEALEEHDVTFLGIHGSGPNDVWVVGPTGQVWRFDGIDWTRVTLPPEYAAWEFWSVYALNPAQLAFSGYKDTYEGFVLQLENDVFTELEIETDVVVKQIRGTSLADLWAVLENGSVLRREAAGWRILAPPLGSRFFSAWNDHPDTLWIGGANGQLMEYTGEFETVSHEFPQSIMRIWGAESDNFYVSGQTGALHHLENGVWNEETPPDGMYIYDLWGPNKDLVMAVGRRGRSALRTNGTWASITTGIEANLTALYSVHGCGASEIWAVGATGTILHYNGAQWVSQVSGSTAQLNDVFCVSPSAVFAVGNGGTTLFYNGSDWTTLNSDTTKNLTAVWGTSRNHVVAVGNDGTIRLYDGSRWNPVESGVGVKLSDVSGTNARNIWVVGSSGVVLRFAGVRFSPVVVPGNPTLNRLHLQPNGRILAAAGYTFLEYRSKLLPRPFVTMECPSTVPLYCQETRSFDTTRLPAVIEDWGTGGNSVTGFNGPETAFTFEAPFSGTVEWKLNPGLTGARLIVLSESAWETCDASTVVALSTTGNDGGQTVSIPVVRNEKYSVVIDAPAAVTGSITSTCTR
ncbi:hypothetical protein KJ975_09390 [Myxococcota bacterium]|nr:hypothetical protein [Myxococcota bacterium]